MTFSIDNPRGLQQPPLGKYVWEKPSGEQGLTLSYVLLAFFSRESLLVMVCSQQLQIPFLIYSILFLACCLDLPDGYSPGVLIFLASSSINAFILFYCMSQAIQIDRNDVDFAKYLLKGKGCNRVVVFIWSLMCFWILHRADKYLHSKPFY